MGRWCVTKFKFNPIPKAEQGQESRVLTYNDIEKKAGCHPPVGLSDSPQRYVWKKAPWNTVPTDDLRCTHCVEHIQAFELYSHLERCHSIEYINCPICDIKLLACEMRIHFEIDHSMDISGCLIASNNKQHQFEIDVQSRSISREIHEREEEGTYHVWVPHELTWRYFPWTNQNKPKPYFKCPYCDDFIRSADIYRHIFVKHKGLKVKCLICGKAVMSGVIDFHMKNEHGLDSL